MNQSDMLFLVMISIGLASLTLVTIQLLKRPKRDAKGEWYEGPWHDDDSPRGKR